MARWAVFVVALALGLAACGDEDEPSSPAASKAKYIQLGDQACRWLRQRDAPLRARLLELGRPGTPRSRYLAEGARLQAKRATLNSELARRLREPVAPDLPDRGIVERYIANIEQIAALEERLADHARLGNRARYDALLDELNPIVLESRGIAQGYGFRVCGS
jgi:hypothetical protein